MGSTCHEREKTQNGCLKNSARPWTTFDLTKAITWDWDDKGLYLICIDKRYLGLQLPSRCVVHTDLPHHPTCFMTVEKQLHFGTQTVRLMRFDENF